MRCMLFAHLGAAITDFSASTADQLGGGRKPAHPADGQCAKIGAITAKPNAQLPQLLLSTGVHPNHIVRAPVADLRAGGTGINVVLHMFLRHSVVLVHNSPLIAHSPLIALIAVEVQILKRKRQTSLAGGWGGRGCEKSEAFFPPDGERKGLGPASCPEKDNLSVCVSLDFDLVMRRQKGPGTVGCISRKSITAATTVFRGSSRRTGRPQLLAVIF